MRLVVVANTGVTLTIPKSRSTLRRAVYKCVNPTCHRHFFGGVGVTHSGCSNLPEAHLQDGRSSMKKGLSRRCARTTTNCKFRGEF